MSNWKFWTWRAELLAAKELEESLRRRMKELEAERAREFEGYCESRDLRHDAEEALRAHDRALRDYAALPRADREQMKLKIKAALAGLGEEHPVWVALNTLLAVHLDVEHRAAKQYGHGTDAALRDFNSGREAGLEDFRAALWKLHHEARNKDN